jgi:uncharacterized membrane protein
MGGMSFDTQVFSDPHWWISQAFAFIALICFVWGWLIKNKVRMMLLIGIASAALAASAPWLGNHSLAILFGLAAVRNFVFAYLDNRIVKGKFVAPWLKYFFAGVFAVCTITASTLILTVFRDVVKVHSVWLEVLICLTLLGLIVGNVLKGTLVMRVSFMANRSFNIINHVYFNSIISVIIAAFAICSNLVYYIKEFIIKLRKRKQQANKPQAESETLADASETEK